MRLNFVKTNPSGNTTIFISDPVPRASQAEVANKIMKPTSIGAEQVGFLERPVCEQAIARLQMAGNEFCGNATRAFAAWLVQTRFPGIPWGKNQQDFSIALEVSGCDELLEAFVYFEYSDSGAKQIQVELPMPLPRSIEDKTSSKGEPYTLVTFEGIVHAIFWDFLPSEAHFQAIKREIKRGIKHSVSPFECLGVMYYDTKKQYLTPIVWVEQVRSLVWESSCGSGTVAVASALAQKKQQSINSLCLHQPGGELEVSIEWDGTIKKARLKGDVSICAQGQVYL
jgi:diaminopimelate epimerase